MGNVRIPVSARLERSFSGQWEGATVRVRLFKGTASDGYKSDFTKRPARWIVWERFDAAGKRELRRASRYGGNRFGTGLTEFAEAVRQLIDAGVTEIPSS